jgi:hypothetical protein
VQRTADAKALRTSVAHKECEEDKCDKSTTIKADRDGITEGKAGAGEAETLWAR